MKFRQDKKNILLEAAEAFHKEVLRGTQLLYGYINDLIEGKRDPANLEKVVIAEHEADLKKERYIEILYKDKRALPFLVEDRYRLIKYLDAISDNSEDLARRLKVFPFELYEDIKDDMKKINDTYRETVEALVEMVKLMETDFKTAYQKSFNIETLKRTARETKYDILDTIYKKKDEKSLRVYLTSKIPIKLFDMVSRAEEISDFLRSLIIKYPSK